MSRPILAIALCRVSSLEQLQNNSLKHQKDIVIKTAEELGVEIPKDGVWEGQVSSKIGLNYKRKDLVEMFEYCKKNSAVKFLIVQEVDRFMRSPDEQTYWIVKFLYEVGVRVWFADKPELNTGTLEASLFRYMDGYRAGGSNKERMSKSINGQTAALKEGRYPFAPKPGYKRGYNRGIPEIHGVRGPALKKVLLDIVNRRSTPTKGLGDLNNSAFMSDGHSLYKMDKFRKIVTDSFYAGVVEIHKQVQVRNENGLHEPLISLEQHYSLVKIMNDKPKLQSGPRKNGNPKYPLSNHINCDLCKNISNGRYVGFDHSNGKNPSLIYEKYRCRSCKKYLTRKEMHLKVMKQFTDSPITEEGLSDLLQALDIVWRQEAEQSKQSIFRIKHKIKTLTKSIEDQVEAITDPGNTLIRQEILSAIEKKKEEVENLKERVSEIVEDTEADKNKFLKFAFNFVENMGSNFLQISPENRAKCKQIVFPEGFYLTASNEVYTPQISPLYRLATNKKDPSITEKSLLVRVKRL